MVLDVAQVMVGSWKDVFGLGITQQFTPIMMFSWGLGLISMVLLLVYFLKLDIAPTLSLGRRTFLVQGAVLGFFAVLMGCLPGWLIGRSVLDDFHANRYALPGMFGMGLLVVAFITWLSADWKKQVVMVSLLAGLAVGFHVRTVNDFRWVWKNQQQLYWQLSWRAPHLKSGTAVFFEEEPFPDQGLFSTSSALNLLYPQYENPHPLGYWAYTLLPRYLDRKPDPTANSLSSGFRSLHFEGNMRDSILMHYDPQRSNCWWLLTTQDQLNPYLSDLEKDWLVISNPDRIEPQQRSADYPPRELFGAEPDRGWCYFYQKADLAQQYGDWETVVALGVQAQAEGYSPNARASNVPGNGSLLLKGILRQEIGKKRRNLPWPVISRTPSTRGCYAVFGATQPRKMKGK